MGRGGGGGCIFLVAIFLEGWRYLRSFEVKKNHMTYRCRGQQDLFYKKWYHFLGGLTLRRGGENSGNGGPGAAKLVTISVVGLSGGEKEKGSMGIGKSCLCNRYYYIGH